MTLNLVKKKKRDRVELIQFFIDLWLARSPILPQQEMISHLNKRTKWDSLSPRFSSVEHAHDLSYQVQ